jgi:predicted nucleic acid-binding protein
VRSLLSFAVLLIAVVVFLALSARQARQGLEAVKTVTLARENVAAQRFDAREAGRMAARLRALCDQSELPTAELEQAAATAAAWAAGLTPGSADYHGVVNLRGAAGDLLAASPALDDPHRASARRHVTEAAAAFSGTPTGGAQGVTGLRDQIQNLQNAERDQLRQVEREKP